MKIHLRTFGFLKGDKGTYSSWKNCPIRYGGYGVLGKMSPKEIMKEKNTKLLNLALVGKWEHTIFGSCIIFKSPDGQC